MCSRRKPCVYSFVFPTASPQHPLAAHQNKTTMIRFLSLFAFLLVLTACGGPDGTELESGEALTEAEEGGTMTSAAGTKFAVDPVQSNVEWEGSKLVGGSHQGTMPLTFGEIMVADNKLVAGRFSIDLRKMENTDLEDAEARAKLIGHLQSADFFETEKYPMAEFTIVNAQAAPANNDGITHNITGNLMLKGQTRSITLPAIVSIDGDTFKASTPEFTIDRKEWGMEYGSGSIAGIAQDNIINDEVGLQLYIVATKQSK